MPIQQRFKTHQTDLLQQRCPSHPRLQNGGSKTGQFTRYKNRTDDELATLRRTIVWRRHGRPSKLAPKAVKRLERKRRLLAWE
jgi:hypothetical protein